MGAGDISMESEAFTARKVNVSVGVGELSVDQISASEKAVFEVGTGDVSILNGQFPKVSIEAGVGDAVFSGSVSNKLEVEAGTGFSQGIFVEYGITVDDEADEGRNGGFGSTTRA